MKKIISFVAAATMLLTMPAIAQKSKSKKEKESKDFTFVKGADLKERRLSIMSAMAGYDNNNAYLIGFRPKVALIFFVPVSSMRYVFQSYSLENMALEKTYRMGAFKKQFKGNRFFGSDLINDEPTMFTYENKKDGKKEKVAINYYTIDKNTMMPSAKNELAVLENAHVQGGSKFMYIMGIAKNSANNTEKINDVNYLRSPDKKSFYIVTITEDTKKKSKKTVNYNIYVNAFNNSMEQLWEKTEKLSFDNAGTLFSAVDADNLGNVYFTVKDYKEKRKGESKKQVRNYEYKLYYISKDKEDLQEVKLNLGDNFVTQMRVKVLDDSIGAVAAGFYYDDKTDLKRDNVSGTFVGVVDKDNNEMLDENFYEFDDKIYSQDVKRKNIATLFNKKKGATEDDHGTEDIEMRKLYVRPDGKILVTGERYYMYVTYTTTTSSNGMSRTKATYHYIHNDILVNCISPAGQTEWTVRIPKFQHQINGWHLSSFIPLINGNDVYFIYNDNDDNAKLTTSGVFSMADLGGKGSSVFAVKVNGDGEVSKYKVAAATDLDGYVCITGANNIDNKKIIFPVISGWGRVRKYGMIDFKAPKE